MTRSDRGGDGDGDTVSWRELLAETTALLDEPMHARWICETATATSSAEFLAMLDQPATQRTVAHLDAMVARARGGEPLQYVIGRWGFRRLDLAIDRRVLIPRPETELVAGVAIDLAAAAGPDRTVADLGTGSGAIGLSLADELPIDGTTVWLTDRSEDAIAVARANLAGLGRAAANVRVSVGTWYDALPDGVPFDVIVSNPPYVADESPDLEPSVAQWEPLDALLSGDEGLDDLRTIIRDAPNHLRPGGWLVLEHGHDQGDPVRSLMAAAEFVAVQTRRDAAGHERVTLARRAR